jgi:hypothetical protein
MGRSDICEPRPLEWELIGEFCFSARYLRPTQRPVCRPIFALAEEIECIDDVAWAARCHSELFFRGVFRRI